MNLTRVVNYSALESIGSRIFDFITLWIVLNNLSTDDLATFGLATAAIFIFNSILLTPETSLFKYQKVWIAQNLFTKYLSAFISFSILKVSLHYIAALIVLYIAGMNWLFYAILFSSITQHIQAAEIARIYMRMELQQKRVSLFELKSKILLTASALYLFYDSNIEIYFLIYFNWSLIITIIWFFLLRKEYLFVLDLTKDSFQLIWQALKGFSIWTHFSGIATLFIYNSSLLFLGWFAYSAEEIALFTIINKVTNLFFVVPMFLQSIVPIILSNAGMDQSEKFNRLFFMSLVISLSQLTFFWICGKYLGKFFGLETSQSIELFFEYGLVISIGIFLLNITRPFSTYLFIKTNPAKVMLNIFIPSVLLAFIAYPLNIKMNGLKGIAYSMMLVYGFLASMLTFFYFSNKRSK